MPRKNTRTANNTGSIRQRANGKWEARYTVGNQRKSIYGNTQTEVRKKLTEVLRNIDKGSYLAPSKITVANWLETWIDTFAVNSVKPLTLSSYQAIIRNHINPSLGTMELQSVRGVHVQKLYNKMISNGSSPKTVKNVSAVLHKAFAVALKQEYIAINPVDSAELPKATKQEVKPLTDREIPLFLDVIQSSPFCNAYALCLFAGLREGEALGLSWDKIDFEHETIEISQQLQKSKEDGHYYLSDSPKNGQARTIKPPSIAFRYLKDEQLKQLQNRLGAGKIWSNCNNLVFTTELGEHYSFATFYKQFKVLASSIGRPDARPHDLRHTTATVAIASGADIKSVQSLLGHATASFTLNTYAHTSEKMQQDTANRMQGYYDSINA